MKKDFYIPTIKSKKNITEIPLLLDTPDIVMTLKKLHDVKKRNDIDHIYDYELLTNIVAGASLISIKTSH